ncbi:MAG TPA: group 1 truncated hemoglobin [Polyangiaceae bacterium]|nr:group 1 truncated hemoglobin [Polyangiaceae bacterium]
MTSLYEVAGGEDKIRAVLTSLYDQLFADPMVGFLFQGKNKAHIVAQQVAFTCSFLGGPQRYEGKSLPEAHASLPLLPGHFDRRHHLLAQVLERQDVPETVRLAWLRIDQSLRTSVLSTGVQARERTRS